MATRRLVMQLHLRRVLTKRQVSALSTGSVLSCSALDARIAGVLPTSSSRRTFVNDTKTPGNTTSVSFPSKDPLQQRWASLLRERAKLDAAIAELDGKITTNEAQIMDAKTSDRVRASLERRNQHLEKRVEQCMEERNTVTEALKNITEEMKRPSKLAPLSTPLSRFAPDVQSQYEELVRLALVSLSIGNIPRLEFNKEAQDERLGDFSKGDAVLPFLVIDGKAEPDLRFSTTMTGGSFVPEAEQIVKLSGLLLLLATSASGKTRSLFDAARQTYMIYVTCMLGKSSDEQKNLVDEYRAAEKVFPAMVDAIWDRCNQINDPNAKQAEAYRIVAADICSRVVFLNWLLETYNNKPELCTPEQFLLLQLHGGQEQMFNLFNQLVEEPIHVIEDICEYARARLAARGVRPIFAIDEAQIAAGLCSNEAPTGCVFEHVSGKNRPRSLLYAYSRKADALLVRPPMVISGTGLTRNSAQQVPTDLGKENAKLEPLPVLLQDGVRQRLKSLLNVTDEELEQVYCLERLAGRPRWTAAVVRRLVNGTLANQLVGQSKSDVLIWYITNVVDEATQELVEKLSDSRQRDGDLMRLLRNMFVIFSTFTRGQQAIKTFFTDAEAQAMLRFGLGQVIDPSSTRSTVPVALDDYVTRKAVLAYADKQNWSVGAALLENFAKHYDSSMPIANGLRFETVVGGAIASYSGPVEEFVKAAANLANDSEVDLPAWVKYAMLGGVAFEDVGPTADTKFDSSSLKAIAKINELVTSNRSGLIRPPNTMRPDLFGPIGLDSVMPFSVIVSTKLFEEAMAGDAIVDDMASTMPAKCFEAKPSRKSKPDFKGDNVHLIDQWTKTWDTLNSRTAGRVLRIHVAFRDGYSKNLGGATVEKLEALGEFDKPSEAEKCAKGPRTLPVVRVKGNEVRVIIDARNYAALFVEHKLQGGIATLLGVKTTHNARFACP